MNMEALQTKEKKKINLPKISMKRFENCIMKRDRLLNDSEDEKQDDYDREEVQQLDEWSNSLPVAKRKRNQTSESIVFLYKNNNRYNAHNLSHSKFSGDELSMVNFTLIQLEADLLKIKKINYEAIYQNIQYCTGVYQNAFNALLKEMDKHRHVLESVFKTKAEEIINLRSRHQSLIAQFTQRRKQKNNQPPFAEKFLNIISSGEEIENMKNSFMQENQALHNEITKFRENIEGKQNQLKNIKKILNKVEQSRVKVLKFSLQLGYDIRDEGLIWILRELSKSQMKIRINGERESKIEKGDFDHKQLEKSFETIYESPCLNQNVKIPKMSQFPNFLTEQEINFIICKFKNDFKLQKIEIKKDQKNNQEKTIIKQAYNSLQRHKNRRLSMIKEKQLLDKLNKERKTERVNGHKYLYADTLKLVYENQNIKATKYELIYKETIRKLNRLCTEEIYGKKSLANGQRKSILNADQIMNDVRNMLSETTKLKEEEEKIKTGEEKQLSQILKKLRSERYSGSSSLNRNPISIIGCLVGWKKAKKIIETEMNISLAISF